MKICKICLQSDYLCSACTQKLESGKITKTDMDVSRALFKLSREIKNFEADFINAVDTEKMIFIFCYGKDMGSVIGKGGKNIAKLEKMLGKKVRVIQHTSNEKELIKNIVGVPIYAINKIYDPEETIKIRIEKKYQKRADKNSADVVKKVIGKDVKIVFE
jgi:transcription antitermination factor NusA-like protein